MTTLTTLILATIPGQLLDDDATFSWGVQTNALNATVRIVDSRPTMMQANQTGILKRIFGGKRKRRPNPIPFGGGRQSVKSIGSGVIIAQANDAVYVLTASHVVNRPERIAVHFVWRDGKSHPPVDRVRKEIIARDKQADLALIRLDYRGEVPGVAPIRIVQIGAPFRCLSVGCDDGSFPWCWESRVTRGEPQSWVTERPPWHGRSGGPLLDTAGRTVGICSAYSDSKKHREGRFGDLRSIHKLCRDAGQAWLVDGSRPRELPRPPRPAVPYGRIVPPADDCPT